jgi:hypothetical protein
MKKYTISFIFKEGKITPEQKNDSIQTSFLNSNLSEEMLKNNIPLDSKLLSIEVYRPNINTTVKSMAERVFENNIKEIFGDVTFVYTNNFEVVNNIEPSCVSFEQARLLKNKGFNLPTLMFYPDESWKQDTLYNSLHTEGVDDASQLDNESWGNIFYAPEQWQVVEWLRINHGIWVAILEHSINGKGIFYEFVVKGMTFSGYNSPQEAYSAAFDYTLKELI